MRLNEGATVTEWVCNTECNPRCNARCNAAPTVIQWGATHSPYTPGVAPRLGGAGARLPYPEGSGRIILSLSSIMTPHGNGSRPALASWKLRA